jgi:nucleoid-associated protein YgaU
MIASDENKDLSLFNISDTVNYKMKGTKAEHILQSGETLTMIALKYYGTKKLWPYIAAYNNVKNFNTLIPGSKILVPVLENK